MKTRSQVIRNLVFLFAVVVLFSAVRAWTQTSQQKAATSAQAPFVPARITEAIDNTKLVTLKGNVHPLARVGLDQGALDDSQPVSRALLLLQRSAAQEAALEQYLDDQQTKNSPSYHAWLTPTQFGQLYGPADSDVQTVTQWLTSQGFQNIKVGPGKTAIEFSGTAGDIKNAFHAELHHLLVNGKERVANLSDPEIPEALAPVVGGVVSLNNFPKRSYLHDMGTFQRNKATGEVKPLFTFPGGCEATGGTCYALSPADFAKIYGITGTGLDGTGQTIAIVAETNIYLSDVEAFRSIFGLPANDPTIILDGPDPGVLGPDSTGEEAEGDLDSQWSGAVAPMAKIDFVVSETPDTAVTAGIDLSALYIIDNNLAPVMSESYGGCELGLGNTGNAFYNALWEQASAEGITVILSAGDTGSASCDPSENSANLDVAFFGQAVSGFASTPFDVALGGTDFYYPTGTSPSTFWGANIVPPGAPAGTVASYSAQSYIPESTWNGSCASSGGSGCTANVVNGNIENPDLDGIDLTAGSGGPSNCQTQNSSGVCTAGYAKPAWQTGVTGVPSDNVRDVPDVSLFASNGINGSFYPICEEDANASQGGSSSSCDINSPYEDFQGVGGTSAAAPTFAGIMALINQNDVSNGGTGRQGNANYVLYQLYKKNQTNSAVVCASNAAAAAATGCMFYDVVTGNNSVGCEGGTPDCSNTNGTAANEYGFLATKAGGTTPAWSTTAGYDTATGLGSINVAQLVQNWSSAGLTASTTTLTTSATTLNHGTSATFNVTVTGSGGTPSGPVSLIVTSGSVVQGIGPFALSGSGTVTINTPLLQGGSPDSIVAHYGGNGNFAQSTSPAVNVTVNKESSATFSTFVVFNSEDEPVGSNYPVTAVYGSPYILRFDVTNSSGTPCSNNLNSGATPPPIDTIPCPTGQVSVTDNGAALNDYASPNSTLPAGTTTVNSQGFFEDQPVQLGGGSHSIVATYAGDNSYNGSTSAAGSITITKATTEAYSLGASPSTGITAGTQVTLTAVFISPSSNGAGLTNTVQFKDGSTSLSTPASCMSTAASNSGPATCTATLNTTFSFLAPPFLPRQMPQVPAIPVWIVACLLVLMILLSLKWLPARRRGYAFACLVFFVFVAAGIAGCSGGSSGGGGGGGGGGGQVQNITAVYSGDNNYSGSTSPAIQITVQ